MNTRIAPGYIIVICPLTTAVADTKVILPHSQHFAETGINFLLEKTIPGFKTLEGVVWELFTLSSQCPNKDFSAPFRPIPQVPPRNAKVHSLSTCTIAV
jgi:hypothetical protein